MTLIERLFTRGKFANERNDGTVNIVGNRLIYSGKPGFDNGEVYIDHLQYAYVVVDNYRESLLFLFDQRMNLIPVNYIGFKKAYEELSGKFGFNDTVFFDNVKKSRPLKKELWRKRYEPTYDILKGAFNDISIGFEIQSPEKRFISWDTPYAAFKLGDHIMKSEFISKKFKYPVRLGNIIFRDFYTNFHVDRTDLPILCFRTECFNESGSDKSFDDLENILRLTVELDGACNDPAHVESWRRCAYIKSDGINFSMTYDAYWGFGPGYTLLEIYNKRAYPEVLIDIDYENKIVVSDFLVFEGKIEMVADYKKDPKTKRRQQKITDRFQYKAVIWTDDINNKIGFADEQFSQVYDREEIISFSIQNAVPAKGGGSGNLEIVLKNQQYNYPVLTSQYQFFDEYVDRIKHLTNKELAFATEYSDV